MPEPCRSCERREIDWGGCRCQALALTGDAGNTDPVCEKSSERERVLEMAHGESAADLPVFEYRSFGESA